MLPPARPVMIPIYAVASLASLWSLQAAFFIDAVRDVYEVRPLVARPALPLRLHHRHSGQAACCQSFACWSVDDKAGHAAKTCC
jgi:hypothetical protein